MLKVQKKKKKVEKGCKKNSNYAGYGIQVKRMLWYVGWGMYVQKGCVIQPSKLLGGMFSE
jgi:hypothetical protein